MAKVAEILSSLGLPGRVLVIIVAYQEELETQKIVKCDRDSDRVL